jgi:NADH-quinone oxidoreductase subunit J
LMGSKMLVMLVLGIALFTTMVAAVLLATHRGRYDRYGDDLDRSQADDPMPGGVGR